MNVIKGISANKRSRVSAYALIAVLMATLGAASAMADSSKKSRKNDGNPFKFVAVATGAQEVPVDPDTAAVGRIVVQFDRGLTRAKVRMHLRGVETPIVGAHLHCNRAGLNGPVAFGLMNPGQLNDIGEHARLTLTNADAIGDCTGFIGRPVNNIAALYFAMRDGLIYFNVHSLNHPPGVVRGQMLPSDD